MRRKNNILQTLALVIKKYIEDFVILAIVVGRYHPDILPVGVLVSRPLEFLFLAREMPNNLFGRDSL